MLTPTHYHRTRGYRAELLADRDGTALYKVDDERRVGRGRGSRLVIDSRLTACTSERFNREFAAR